MPFQQTETSLLEWDFVRVLFWGVLIGISNPVFIYKTTEGKLVNTSLKDGVDFDNPCIFQAHNVTLYHIESRPAKRNAAEYEFYADCDNKTGGLNEALKDLKGKNCNVTLLTRKHHRGSSKCTHKKTHVRNLCWLWSIINSGRIYCLG